MFHLFILYQKRFFYFASIFIFLILDSNVTFIGNAWTWGMRSRGLGAACDIGADRVEIAIPKVKLRLPVALAHGRRSIQSGVRRTSNTARLGGAAGAVIRESRLLDMAQGGVGLPKEKPDFNQE